MALTHLCLIEAAGVDAQCWVNVERLGQESPCAESADKLSVTREE